MSEKRMTRVEMIDATRREMARQETEARAIIYRWRNEPGAQPGTHAVDRAKAKLDAIETDRAHLDLDPAGLSEWAEFLATRYLPPVTPVVTP